MYIDKRRVAELEAALAANSRGDAGARVVATAARRALESANSEGFDHLIERIGEMGEALTDEDGSASANLSRSRCSSSCNDGRNEGNAHRPFS